MRRLVILLSYFPLLVLVAGQVDLNRERPCEHPNAINLPQDKKCLVPIKTAYSWKTALSTCERAGGSLFQTPDALLTSKPELLWCLASMSEFSDKEMWVNALGKWSPHFTWTNKTSMNRPEYCPTTPPLRADTYNASSDSLSVDYCAFTCRGRSATYTVYYNRTRVLECYCIYNLPANIEEDKCSPGSVSTNVQGKYYIIPTIEDSMITITSSNSTSSTESLCATIDSDTFSTRRITSEKCFSPQHFICDLGDESKCSITTCQGAECRFITRRRCILRVSMSYSWYAARVYCQRLGGDLWNLYALGDLEQVVLQPARTTKYWIGATNYDWKFDANSADLGNEVNMYNRVRCGYMIRRTTSGSEQPWYWDGTVCDQQKAFLCQFPKTTFTAEEMQTNVMCLGTVPPTPAATTPTDGGAETGSLSGSHDDSFPVGAVIAAIIAGLILLACLALSLAFCSRRNWMAGRFKKAREHLAFIPYFADVSGTDYDSHHNMSSVSDHGSQVGLVKNGYHNGNSGYGMSTSYGEQSGAFSSKSLDRRQKDAMDRKLAESKNYLISGNSSMDERAFAATYNTLPNRPRDFMTLQAHMDIKDEAELAALRGSLRHKPEVALVTDNVDMNFTVNHAVSRMHSHNGSELSRSSLERTMEEITLPASEGGMGLNLPERVAEESRLHSTMTRNYHGM